MGRITIFSSDGCPHCKRAKAALKARNIPFVNISVTQFPERRKDMLALSDRISTPQVFFNTRHVGGADDTLALLSEWDENKKHYKTAFDRYQTEIAMHPDPMNPRLAVPVTGFTKNKLAGRNRGESQYSITLPKEGTKATVLEVNEILKKLLPSNDNFHKLTLYKESFKGSEAVGALANCYNISREEALAFGRTLQTKHRMIRHVHGEHALEDTDRLFRLQCNATPEILNSYRVWADEEVSDNAMHLVDSLTDMMSAIEVSVTDDCGGIDYKRAARSPLYSVFEEAVCELQKIDIRNMNDTTKTAFGINIYNLMIKYAFTKVGVGVTKLSRSAFYSTMKFNIGGYNFSFQDWENGILRGNGKAPYALGLPLSKKDPRYELIVKNPDCRIHFALNCGAKSCPPVNNYSAENLEEELEIVANSFCEDDSNVFVDVKTNQLHLSSIFKWYRVDFAESNKQLPGVVLKYLRRVKKQQLERMIDSGKSIKVVTLTYDWTTNAKNVTCFSASDLQMNVKTVKGLFKNGGNDSVHKQIDQPLEQSIQEDMYQ